MVVLEHLLPESDLDCFASASSSQGGVRLAVEGNGSMGAIYVGAGLL